MTTGLRERKKAATREALHAAAVRLVLAHGIENLTVEAIADEAFVSRRTFSNYFASKEQALMHHDRTRAVRLVELVRARPAEEAPRTALIRAAEELHAEYAEVREVQYRALRLHPTLLPELAAAYTAVERHLADAVEQRLPDRPDRTLRAQVLAATFLVALRIAGQTVLENPGRDFMDLTRQAVAFACEDLRQETQQTGDVTR
ncbi:TetR/AcrR family transcriptional regulator [Streptomyces sp. NPDC101776]|uniref:TetR/AcrR family transcriptional regulator n=1 Tax=Streptomyces sp. NPDC101776 TaxID=3366146 RepID=UPI0037F44EA2